MPAFTRRSILSLLALAPATPLAARAAGERPQAILFYGQSNAGAGGTAKPILTVPQWESVVSFRGSRQAYGTHVLAPERLTATASLADAPEYAPFPATATGFALAMHASRENRPTVRYFMHTVWYGGQPLDAFTPMRPTWTSLMNVARRFRPAMGAPDAEIGALAFIHGEAGPWGREAYGIALTQLLRQIGPALQEAAGQERAPIILLTQVHQPQSGKYPATGVEMAQWDVARAMDGAISLATPTYAFPLADNIHHSAEGRMMLGEALAFAYQESRRTGRPFQALQPLSATRDGRLIELRFSVPAGAGPLAFDGDWVPATTNAGFVFADDTRSAAIERIEISGDDRLSIWLDRVPVGANRRLLYAQGQEPATGWSAARGQLMVPSGRRSAFAAAGHRVPADIRHYAIRFTLPIA